MYVGRPTPHKNLGRLIDAYVSLKRTYPELKLVLAGKKDSNYRTIEASTKARGIDGVYFTDFISDGQLKWLYQNCLAYVFPSLSEGFGLPGLEAMLNGAAVVCSNETCLPEIYANAAAYFDPLSVGSMSEAIGKILQNQALRQELIKKGLAKANEYSWEHMAKQTLKLYIEAF
jgi:glycosyltransferase involved in cell wall biosynthesis